MMEFGLLDDFIEELNLEKDFRKKVKTQEELDKLTVDENLNEIDKAIYILNSGQQPQFISVIRNLPNLLKSWPEKSHQKVVPKIRDMLSYSDTNLHTAASETFCKIANVPELPPSVFIQHFLKIVLRHLKDPDPTVANIWSNSLVEMLNRVPGDVIVREVLPVASVMGQLSKPTSSRLQCCKIVGAMASKFDLNTIKVELVPKIKLLCQDVDQDVRTCMCSHLHTIAKAMGAAETRHLILTEILELVTDEEHQVVEAAYDAFLTISPLLDQEHLLRMKPLLMEYCTLAIQIEDSTLKSVASKFGKLCESVKSLLSMEERRNLVDIYHRMCLLGRTSLKKNDGNITKAAQERLAELSSDNYSIPRNSSMNVSRSRQDLKKDDLLECRRSSAFNLPAMFDIFRDQQFRPTLMECSLILASDDDVTVRQRVASGLHEVARILGPQAHSLRVHLHSILRQNESYLIVEGCLPYLGSTLVLVAQYDNDSKGAGVAEIVISLQSALTKFEGKWHFIWRPLKEFVVQLRVLPEIISSDQIYNKFLPPLFTMLTKNPYLPVRRAVAHTICVLLRYNKRTDQRREILEILVQDLCQSRSYRDRLLFLDLCQNIIDVFSRRFFKQNIFVHAMSLFDDKVVNVRLCLCRILPSMKMMLKVPNDRILHSQLEEGVRKFLSSENDKDVSRAIRLTILELDRTVLKRPATTEMSDADRADEKKEEEENVLASKEEKDTGIRGHGSSLSALSFRGQKGGKFRKRSSLLSVGGMKRPDGSKDPNQLGNSSSWSYLQNSSTSSNPNLTKRPPQDRPRKPGLNSKKTPPGSSEDWSTGPSAPRAATTDKAGFRKDSTGQSAGQARNPGPNNRKPSSPEEELKNTNSKSNFKGRKK